MSRPDLSFLLQNLEPPPLEQGSPPAPQPLPPGEVTQHVDALIMSEVDALIRELRNYQVELEAQNKVLRYSQAAAESASERFEALFAHVPLALMVLDEHDVVIQANAMAHRRFQPTEHDRPLSALSPFVAPEHLERVRTAFAQARESGHAEVHEVVLIINADDWLSGDLHMARIDSTVEGEDSQVQYLCAIIDQGPLLAERRTLRERNEQLHASEKRLESIINSSLDAILCVDQEQRITVFNPTASVLFQCPTVEALGSRLVRFLPAADQVLAFAHLTTQASLGEMTALTASGKELAIEVSVSFERHASGETITVFARDLTGRKKADAHRNELEAQLRESHKMRAMGTMAGGIAHDFNNILGAILGNVELAKADCPRDAPALESLQEIEKAGRRARDLVQQILTFSRNEPPRRIPVPLLQLLNDTERLVRVTLPPAIDMVVHPCAESPTVLADPTQVEQAVLNLCTNAVQAMDGNRGSIRISVDFVHLDPRAALRLDLSAGNYAVITVEDSGPGMDEKTLQRVFEPFFTTKPVGQGTGLGLAVVHGVMRNHEGSVEVSSTPGVGSRFSLYFPADELPCDVPVTEAAPYPELTAALKEGKPSAKNALTAMMPEAAMPKEASLDLVTAPSKGDLRRLPENPSHHVSHVMYVDDDEALVFLVQRLLKRLGYGVSCFTDPQQALQALREQPMAFDLIVTDYNMPGFSGVDLVREAKTICPQLPIALASGYVTSEIEQAARAAGAQAMVYKPNDVEELVNTVRQLLSREI